MKGSGNVEPHQEHCDLRGAARARRHAGPGAGAGLSEPADHAGHPAAAGRHQRHHGAGGRRQAQHRARPADRDRKPRRRRQRHRRYPPGREKRARRLHAAAGLYVHPGNRPEHVSQRGLRSAQGFRADRPDRDRAGLAAGASERAGPQRGRADRDDESRKPGVPGRHPRHRHRQLPGLGAVRPAGRRGRAADSVQGFQSVDHRSRRRSRQGRLQSDPGVARRAGGRLDPGTGGNLAETLHVVSGPADRRRIGAARLRCGAELWAGGAGRHAAADHRAAEQGAAGGARHRRGQEAAAPGRRRADADARRRSTPP